MGLLLLLTSTLLSIYVHPGIVANAQQLFAIREITLSVEPSTDVTRDTNVTLRCKASISSSGQVALSREYTIYKDDYSLVYNKTSSTPEDLLYHLPEARVSDTGKYKCMIKILGANLTSEDQRLTVTGLSKPVLNLNKDKINEGEEVTATCTAPGETGSIFFRFYDGTKEILEKRVKSNQAEAKLRFSSAHNHEIKCAYTVLIKADSFKSEKSNSSTVSVKELSVTTVLEISPQSSIYEGDQLLILCTSSNSLNSSEKIQLDLIQGTEILHRGVTKVNHSMVAKGPGEFECVLEIGNVKKIAKKTVPVAELFSVPTLTISAAEVFQKEDMTLTCKSERYASQRLRREDLTYTLDPPNAPLIHSVMAKKEDPGVFHVKALQYDSNYTCVAQAKNITKRSKTLTVRPKVAVSTPVISVADRAVLGQSFKILCRSDTGSHPINYTLLRDNKTLDTISVKNSSEKALFTVTITKPEEINQYRCEAKNSHKEPLSSERLDELVIVPLTHPTLIVTPDLADITEGNDLYFICRIEGTPPVTFKFYREGNEQPLHTTTNSSRNHTNYQIPMVSKEHSGRYYCDAVNRANIVVRSDLVTIEVRLALWKKVLIGGFCLLAVSVLVVVCVLCFKSKRGKREAAAELSVKPSSPKSDDSLTVNLTHDTEVYNAATVVVDRATVSVWSKRPPEAANDEESSVVSSEPDVEYTEVVHPRPVDPARVPLRKGTDTVYSELQNSPHGAADHHDYGSVEYAELNGEQPEINHYHPEVNNYQDLPVPVD